jgi:hypothetical protein
MNTAYANPFLCFPAILFSIAVRAATANLAPHDSIFVRKRQPTTGSQLIVIEPIL